MKLVPFEIAEPKGGDLFTRQRVHCRARRRVEPRSRRAPETVVDDDVLPRADIRAVLRDDTIHQDRGAHPSHGGGFVHLPLRRCLAAVVRHRADADAAVGVEHGDVRDGGHHVVLVAAPRLAGNLEREVVRHRIADALERIPGGEADDTGAAANAEQRWAMVARRQVGDDERAVVAGRTRAVGVATIAGQRAEAADLEATRDAISARRYPHRAATARGTIVERSLNGVRRVVNPGEIRPVIGDVEIGHQTHRRAEPWRDQLRARDWRRHVPQRHFAQRGRAARRLCADDGDAHEARVALRQCENLGAQAARCAGLAQHPKDRAIGRRLDPVVGRGCGRPTQENLVEGLERAEVERQRGRRIVGQGRPRCCRIAVDSEAGLVTGQACRGDGFRLAA